MLVAGVGRGFTACMAQRSVGTAGLVCFAFQQAAQLPAGQQAAQAGRS